MTAENSAIFLGSAQETDRLAEIIGRFLVAGDVLALVGPLGAGKTRFTQALFRALGVTDRVSSPTFTLVNEHSGVFALAHIDLYRLNAPEDVEDLGYEEYFAPDRVAVVEWADRALEYLPPMHIRIQMEHVPGKPCARLLTIGTQNPRSAAVAAEVNKLWRSSL